MVKIERKDVLVPFGDGTFAFLYRNCLEYWDRMSNEERYEANIRSDFRTRPPRLVRDHEGLSIVRVQR